MSDKPYSVNLWGSDPDLGNDDCWTGFDVGTLDEARVIFAALTEGRLDDLPAEDTRYIGGTQGYAWVELDGPDLNLASPNKAYDARLAAREAEADRRAWRNEIATQAGMGLGCDGYNDAMGY